jgi:hypothetical protein
MVETRAGTKIPQRTLCVAELFGAMFTIHNAFNAQVNHIAPILCED